MIGLDGDYNRQHEYTITNCKRAVEQHELVTWCEMTSKTLVSNLFPDVYKMVHVPCIVSSTISCLPRASSSVVKRSHRLRMHREEAFPVTC